MQEVCTGAKYLLIATPPDYDTVTNKFNSGSVEAGIRDVESVNPDTVIIIKFIIHYGKTHYQSIAVCRVL